MANASAMVATLTPWLPLQGVIAPTHDSSWHAPSQSRINNLTEAVNGPGTYGFLFNSSSTPDEQYGTYNWCNMPHVRRGEYVRPPDEYRLIYVELMHRHHKRTPYATNGFPVESYPWDCDDERLHIYARPSEGREAAPVYRWGYTSGMNPFSPAGWAGSCQFPQITDGGLLDSWQHGADLYDVYHSLLSLLPTRSAGGGVPQARVRYRVTNNPITSQVAGMVINGMWDTQEAVPLWTQASSVDSLEPKYACPKARALFSAIMSNGNPEWQRHLEASRGIFDQLDRISGVSPDDVGFHESIDHYFDNLSARQCHDKPLPCRLVDGRNSSDCVSQDLADTVYRLGNWEYGHVYRGHPDSLAASAASLGVWISELAAHIRDAISGRSDTVYFHNVAHDGSVSRVLSILQVDQMVWPGMGAEVVFELYRKDARDTSEEGAAGRHQQQTLGLTNAIFYVRVLFGGRVLESSSPALGRVDMLPAENFLAYLDDLVGQGGKFDQGKCQIVGNNAGATMANN